MMNNNSQKQQQQHQTAASLNQIQNSSAANQNIKNSGQTAASLSGSEGGQRTGSKLKQVGGGVGIVGANPTAISANNNNYIVDSDQIIVIQNNKRGQNQQLLTQKQSNSTQQQLLSLSANANNNFTHTYTGNSGATQNSNNYNNNNTITVSSDNKKINNNSSNSNPFGFLVANPNTSGIIQHNTIAENSNNNSSLLMSQFNPSSNLINTTSSKIDFNKTQLSSRNSAPTKQYKYWIDVQDLLNLIKFVLHYQLQFQNTSDKNADFPKKSENIQSNSHNNNLFHSQNNNYQTNSATSTVNNCNNQNLVNIQTGTNNSAKPPRSANSATASISSQQNPFNLNQNSNYNNNDQNKNNNYAQINQQVIERIVENDVEIEQFLNMLVKEFGPNYNLNEILQLNRGFKKVYLLENQKVITQVYESKLRSDIQLALRQMIEKLQDYQIKFRSKTLRICFSSHQELYSIFLKIFGYDLFQQIAARKMFNDLWEGSQLFREDLSIMPTYLMNHFILIKIELFCKGRAIFDQSRRDYPLHQAVFENNLPLISRLVKCAHDGTFFAEKNEIDAGGNTPLILAVKLGNVDAVKVLTDLFTCPKMKSFSNFPCALDVASAMKHKEIIRILLEANQKIKQHYLDLHKEAIFSSLESLPDFKIDIHFNCKSNFIPFVRNIAPSDTFKISKQGSKLRLDMTLVGFRQLKCVRGNLSVLFKGRDQQNEGELFVVDHESKSVSNIFNDIAYAKIDKDLEDILSDKNYQKLYKADKFKIEPETDKKGEIRSKQIEGVRAEKFNLKTQYTMTKFRINMQEVQSIQKYKNYEEYKLKNTFDFQPLNSQSEKQNECGSRPDSKMISQDPNLLNTQQHINWNPLNAASPNPHFLRVETEGDAINHQILTQGNREHNLNIVTSNTVQGYATDKKITKKTISASIWLSNQHPLSLESFLPLLQVLSFSSKQISKFKDHLIKYQLPKGYFPLKAKVPLFLTMKATFALQNLIFETSDFAPNLFTVDEEYIEIRHQHNLQYQLLNQNRLLQLMNKNSPSPNSAAQTLKEIYKLCKTDEDCEDDDEDSDSIERANELFNSMLKKVNQSEELLLEMSSFHSEYDSVDLSERQLNDESFKLGTHAFSKIQTMNSINVRHKDDDELNFHSQNPIQKQIQEYKNLSNNQRRIKFGRKKQSGPKNLLNQTNEGENIFDSKILEERPTVNYTITKRSFTKSQKPPTNGPPLAGQDTAKTLKKNFQPRNLKNYKNMFKYGSNQNQFEATYNFQGIPNIDPNANTPAISTADTSLLTNKLSSFFIGQSQFNRRDQSAWFRQLLSYKNNLAGTAGGYLHTIESEEVMGTEGPANDGISQIGNQTIGMNNSVLMTGSNFDDNFSRKSFIQSFTNQNNNNNNIYNNQSLGYGATGQYNHNNNINSSRESSLKSFNSGGTPMIQPQNNKSGAMSGGNSYTNKDEKKTLVNHNALISRFHNYVNQHQQYPPQMIPTSANQLQTSLIQQNTSTPQKKSNKQSTNSENQAQTPQQMIDIAQGQAHYQQLQMLQYQQQRQIGAGSIEPPSILHSANNNKQASRQSSNNNVGNNNNKSLLPPKVAHRRQSSYGGSSSNITSYLGNVQQQQQTTQIQNQSGSGGIFNKIFGGTFNRNSGLQGHGGVNIQNHSHQEPEISPFSAIQSATVDMTKPKSSQQQHQQIMAFQTFDHPRQTTSRTTSNTQYQQNAPPLLGFTQNSQQTNSAVFMKGLLSHTNKKTNDVDIFLPYQV